MPDPLTGPEPTIRGGCVAVAALHCDPHAALFIQGNQDRLCGMEQLARIIGSLPGKVNLHVIG